MTWKRNPYDVMSAYLENTRLVNTPKAVIGQTSYTDIKKFNNGFGVHYGVITGYKFSILNRAIASSNALTVRASYQHAQSSVTLNESKNYDFSTNGYGGVIRFRSSTVAEKYDQMGGVSVTL